MAGPEYLQPRYFGAMDRPSYLAPKDTGYFQAMDETGDITVPQNALGEDTGLKVSDIGATLNPSQNQLQALQAKIREGASKVEFEFMGRQKGNAQQPTPEMHSRQEREAIRQLLALNKVTGSTHATFTVSGLAGFTNQGFSKQQQEQVMQEVRRAIDFAKDATTGGAIVVHTGEWIRPVRDAAKRYGDIDEGNVFSSYEDEDKEGVTLLVDKETGAFIRESTQINQGTVLDEPEFMTAKDYKKQFGKELARTQTIDLFDEEGKKRGTKEVHVDDDDWVDVHGNIINPGDTKSLFRRVPLFDKAHTEFKTNSVGYEEMDKRAKKYREKFDMQITPEVLFAQTQLDNQILQQKGSSLFHGRGYDLDLQAYKEATKKLDEYESEPEKPTQAIVEELNSHLTAIQGIRAQSQQSALRLQSVLGGYDGETQAFLQAAGQERLTDKQITDFVNAEIEKRDGRVPDSDLRAFGNKLRADIDRMKQLTLELPVSSAQAEGGVQQYLNTAIDSEETRTFLRQRIAMTNEEEAKQLEEEFIEKRLNKEKKQLEDAKKRKELDMKYTHEASGSADARAEELLRRRRNITDIEEYGLERSGKALGKLALEAMEANKKAKSMRNEAELKQWEDMFIAPENIFANEYGSHPTELLNIVRAGREDFKKRLKKRGVSDKKEREALARKHIKTTFDIGHLNMWRNLLEQGEKESDEAFQNRFNTWMEKHLEALHKEDAIGHLHITDNFGINDSHLTAGEGNAPIKEFVQWLTKKGYKDFIVEAGGFNVGTYMHDSWAYLGATPSKGSYRPFGSQWKQHSGQYGAPRYMVGSYVPSNEWTLWSGVPLE